MSWHHLGYNRSHMLILQRSPQCLDLQEAQSQEGWGARQGEISAGDPERGRVA